MKLKPYLLGFFLATWMTCAAAETLSLRSPATVRFRESSPPYWTVSGRPVEARLEPSGFLNLPEYLGNGLYSLSEDVVFIHGSLRSRSVLLRSKDGGQSWREADLTPERGRGVIELLFLDQKTGWAKVAAGAGEGIQGVWLFGTTDGGKSWEKLSLLMGYAAGSWIARIKFYDEMHGQLLIYRDLVSAPSDGIEIKETSDGGRTWDSIVRIELGLIEGIRHSFSNGSFEKTSIGGVVEEISRQLREQLRQFPKPFAVAPDGSQWRMVSTVMEDDGTRRKLGPEEYRSDGSSYISVQRRLNKDAVWEERSFIPRLYEMGRDFPVPVPVTKP